MHSVCWLSLACMMYTMAKCAMYTSNEHKFMTKCCADCCHACHLQFSDAIACRVWEQLSGIVSQKSQHAILHLKQCLITASFSGIWLQLKQACFVWQNRNWSFRHWGFYSFKSLLALLYPLKLAPFLVKSWGSTNMWARPLYTYPENLLCCRLLVPLWLWSILQPLEWHLFVTDVPWCMASHLALMKMPWPMYVKCFLKNWHFFGEIFSTFRPLGNCLVHNSKPVLLHCGF